MQHEQSIAFSVGIACSYDVYDADSDVLVDEAELVLGAALAGKVTESVWWRHGQPVASDLKFIQDGPNVAWRTITPKFLAKREDYTFVPYP